MNFQGALYAFPQIRFPPKAIEAASKKEMPADTFYAFELLENTGLYCKLYFIQLN